MVLVRKNSAKNFFQAKPGGQEDFVGDTGALFGPRTGEREGYAVELLMNPMVSGARLHLRRNCYGAANSGYFGSFVIVLIFLRFYTIGRRKYRKQGCWEYSHSVGDQRRSFSARHIHFVDSIHILPAGLSVVNSGEHMALSDTELVEAKDLLESERPPLS